LDVAAPIVHNAAIPGAVPVNVFNDQSSLLALGGATSFQVLANVTDNQQLVAVEMRVLVGGTEHQASAPMTFTGEGAAWTSTVENAEQGRAYTVIISAQDRVGHSSSFSFIVATS
jgi:hypothetical protein